MILKLCYIYPNGPCQKKGSPPMIYSLTFFLYTQPFYPVTKSNDLLSGVLYLVFGIKSASNKIADSITDNQITNHSQNTTIDKFHFGEGRNRQTTEWLRPFHCFKENGCRIY